MLSTDSCFQGDSRTFESKQLNSRRFQALKIHYKLKGLNEIKDSYGPHTQKKGKTEDNVDGPCGPESGGIGTEDGR